MGRHHASSLRARGATHLARPHLLWRRGRGARSGSHACRVSFFPWYRQTVQVPSVGSAWLGNSGSQQLRRENTPARVPPRGSRSKLSKQKAAFENQVHPITLKSTRHLYHLLLLARPNILGTAVLHRLPGCLPSVWCGKLPFSSAILFPQPLAFSSHALPFSLASSWENPDFLIIALTECTHSSGGTEKYNQCESSQATLGSRLPWTKGQERVRFIVYEPARVSRSPGSLPCPSTSPASGLAVLWPALPGFLHSGPGGGCAMPLTSPPCPLPLQLTPWYSMMWS